MKLSADLSTGPFQAILKIAFAQALVVSLKSRTLPREKSILK